MVSLTNFLPGRHLPYSASEGYSQLRLKLECGRKTFCQALTNSFLSDDKQDFKKLSSYIDIKKQFFYPSLSGIVIINFQTDSVQQGRNGEVALGC